MADGSQGSMPLEVMKAFGELQGTIKVLQEKNDANLNEVKKGFDDVVRREELKKINDAIDKSKDEVNRLWKQANRPAMGAVVSDAKSALIETKANREFARWMSVEDPTSSKVIDARKAYEEASKKYVRLGQDRLTDIEKKTLQVGEAPSGGFWVDPVRADIIITKQFETSELRRRARTITINSNSVKFPIDRQRTTANWVGETSSRSTTTTAQWGEQIVNVHELQSQPAITQNMIDDGTIDVEQWANEKIAMDFSLSENAAFVNGTGTAQPRGFLTLTTSSTTDQGGRAFGTIQFVGTGASGAFKTASTTVSPADDLLSLLYAFKPRYRANLSMGMTRTTLGLVRKFKDQLGNYIAGPRLDQNRGLIETVFGYEVDEFADMPELGANSLSIVMADWQQAYLIVDRAGIRQLRDPYTSKPLILLDTTKRVGGDVMDTEAIKLIKFG